MKQKLFTLILLLIAGTLSPTLLMADETLFVGNKTVTVTSNQPSINPSGLTGGTISWNASSKTLTFTDVVFNNSTQYNAVSFTGTRINLVFKGKNVIKSAKNGFSIDASNYCVISSVQGSSTAYLELECTTTNPSSGYYTCIWMKNGVLDIKNIYLKATSNYGHTIYGKGSNSINFQTAWAQITSVNTTYKAVYNFSSCTVENGSYVETGKWNTSNKTFYNGSTAMTSVKILPELTVGGVIVDASWEVGEGQQYGAFAINPNGKTNGSISYENGELTFDGVRGKIGASYLPDNYGNTLVRNSKVDGFRTYIKGTNIINPADGVSTSYGIVTENDKALTIMGATSNYASDKLTYTGDNGVISDGTLDIVFVTASFTGKVPIWAAGGTLTIENSKVTATVPSPVANSQAIAAIGAKLKDCDIANGYLDHYGFYGRDNNPLTTVKIDVPSYGYPVAVLGRYLNNVNISEFANPGFTEGTLSYDTSTNTLTVSGVKIDASDINPDVPGIEVKGNNVCFGGRNDIITGNQPALQVSGDATVYTAEANSNRTKLISYRNVGCNIASNRTLTLKGGVSFFGRDGGLKGASTSTLKLLNGNCGDCIFHSKDKNLDYTNYPAFTVGKFVNNDGLGYDFKYSSQSSPYTTFDAAYWDADKKQPIKNGGKFAQAVCLKPVSTEYGIWVGGIRLNNVNCNGLAANFFTKAGDTQVTYVEHLKTLNLNNADINLKEKSVSAEAIKVYDENTIISLNGENKLVSGSGRAGILVVGKTTITSATKDFKSTLELLPGSGGSGTGIDIENSSSDNVKLTIQDKAVVKVSGPWKPGIGDSTYEGWGGNLDIDDATLDVSNGITSTHQLNLTKCAFAYPVGAKFDKEKRMVVNGAGEQASHIQIFSVNDNVTEMIDAIAINEENFPDAKFRKFVADKTIDKNEDGYLSETEVKAVTTMDVKVLGIEDLKGIEHFTALAELNCWCTGLTSLDVSKNTALEKLDCSYNSLTSLDVSKNTALTELKCSNNSLTSLDVSKNTALRWLYCYDNSLTTLDVSHCKGLEDLTCYNNGMTMLNLSNCTALVELDFSDNSLYSLNISHCKELEKLKCNNSGLMSLDASNLTELKKLECTNNGGMTSLVVSNCTALKELDCSSNSLTSLNVSNCTALELLNCSRNSLTSLDVSNLTALKSVECFLNRLTSLKASNCTKLKEVDFAGNLIEGENMLEFINTLPIRRGDLIVCNDKYSPDNVITAAQVSVAKSKGWNVYKGELDDGWEYAGLGDINFDNKIDQDDLDLLVQIVMGQRPEEVGEFAGDLNNDGKTDAQDVVILVNILNGK